MNGNAFSSWKVDFLLERCLHNKQNNSNTRVQLDISLARCTHLQREARYRFHQRKIFDTFLTLFDWGAGFFRQFEIYARTRLEITATFLNNHRMNFQEIREKSWSGGNGSALRAVRGFLFVFSFKIYIWLWWLSSKKVENNSTWFWSGMWKKIWCLCLITTSPIVSPWKFDILKTSIFALEALLLEEILL